MSSPISQSPPSLAQYLANQVLLLVQGKRGKLMVFVIHITIKMGGGDDDDGCEDFKMWVLFILCSSSDQKAATSPESLLWKQHHYFLHYILAFLVTQFHIKWQISEKQISKENSSDLPREPPMKAASLFPALHHFLARLFLWQIQIQIQMSENTKDSDLPREPPMKAASLFPAPLPLLSSPFLVTQFHNKWQISKNQINKKNMKKGSYINVRQAIQKSTFLGWLF